MSVELETLSSSSVWAKEPTFAGVLVYSVLVPCIGGLGVIFNGLNIGVFTRNGMSASTFTYLTVSSCADWVTCLILIFSGLARGVFCERVVWHQLDALFFLPLGGVSGYMKIFATLAVTTDRLLFVCGALKPCPPPFCCRLVARKVMLCCGVLSIICNLPCLFIYKWTPDVNGTIETTGFFDSSIYSICNWIKFILFCVCPAIYLTVANTILILTVRKVTRKRHTLLPIKNCKERERAHTRLTITLVAVVFLFLVGEVPSSLASRKYSNTLLDSGDSFHESSTRLETFRVVATVLNGVHCAANFLLYVTLNPHFRRQLLEMLKGSKQQESNRNLHPKVTVYVVWNEYKFIKSGFPMTRQAKR